MKTVTALGAVNDSGSGSGEAKAAKAAAGKAVMTAVHKMADAFKLTSTETVLEESTVNVKVTEFGRQFPLPPVMLADGAGDGDGAEEAEEAESNALAGLDKPSIHITATKRIPKLPGFLSMHILDFLTKFILSTMSTLPVDGSESVENFACVQEKLEAALFKAKTEDSWELAGSWGFGIERLRCSDVLVTACAIC